MARQMRSGVAGIWNSVRSGFHHAEVDPDAVVARMTYEHPVYTPESVAAQRRLPELNTPVTAYAGAYHGWGFHEDGARSGLAAVERLGLTWPEPVVG